MIRHHNYLLNQNKEKSRSNNSISPLRTAASSASFSHTPLRRITCLYSTRVAGNANSDHHNNGKNKSGSRIGNGIAGIAGTTGSSSDSNGDSGRFMFKQELDAMVEAHPDSIFVKYFSTEHTDFKTSGVFDGTDGGVTGGSFEHGRITTKDVLRAMDGDCFGNVSAAGGDIGVPKEVQRRKLLLLCGPSQLVNFFRVYFEETAVPDGLGGGGTVQPQFENWW